MHDFRKLVAPGRKADPREEEIVTELAGHLEEMYADLRRDGTSEEQAIAKVSAEGENFGPTIRRLRWQEEGGLQSWLRSVALPALVLFFFYDGCGSFSFDIYWGHQFLRHETGIELIAIALGFCAAFFSRELGGNFSQRRWASISSSPLTRSAGAGWLCSCRSTWCSGPHTTRLEQSVELPSCSSGYCCGT